MLKYRPSFIPNNFVVIGAGGTGSRLVPLLAQFIKTAAWIQNPTMYVIDPDVVEEKNLVRQNFIKPDLGKNKAVVLASRYGPAYGMNILAIPELVRSIHDGANKAIVVEDALTGKSIALEHLTNCIVLMCVDSAQARRDILTRYGRSDYRSRLFIDSGNEDDYGQVTIFHACAHGIDYYGDKKIIIEQCTLDGKLMPVDQMIPFIPFPGSMYTNMEDNKGGSCADLDQTLAINAIMATTMVGIVQNFVYSKPLAFRRINVNLAHGSSVQYLDLNYMLNEAQQATESNPFQFESHQFSEAYMALSKEVTKFKKALAAQVKKVEKPIVPKAMEVEKPLKKVRIRTTAVGGPESPLSTLTQAEDRIQVATPIAPPIPAQIIAADSSYPAQIQAEIALRDAASAAEQGHATLIRELEAEEEMIERRRQQDREDELFEMRMRERDEEIRRERTILERSMEIDRQREAEEITLTSDTGWNTLPLLNNPANAI